MAQVFSREFLVVSVVSSKICLLIGDDERFETLTFVPSFQG